MFEVGKKYRSKNRGYKTVYTVHAVVDDAAIVSFTSDTAHYKTYGTTLRGEDFHDYEEAVTLVEVTGWAGYYIDGYPHAPSDKWGSIWSDESKARANLIRGGRLVKVTGVVYV